MREEELIQAHHPQNLDFVCYYGTGLPRPHLLDHPYPSVVSSAAPLAASPLYHTEHHVRLLAPPREASVENRTSPAVLTKM